MRKAEIERKTGETQVNVQINLRGKGNFFIDTGLPFFDHMLSLMGRHALFDLKIKARGDLAVDAHHLVEDVGIVLGKALKKALKDKKGIQRYGFFILPMDEALVRVALDIDGRGHLVFHFPLKRKKEKFNPEMAQVFFDAFCRNSGITMHINFLYGRNYHHIIEAIFKAMGRALREAVSLHPDIKVVPSTKGIL